MTSLPYHADGAKTITKPGPAFSIDFFRKIISARKSHKLHEYLISLCIKYGPIIRIPPLAFGLTEVIILTDAPESKRVLTSPEFDRTDLMKRLSLSPHALPALTGEEHKRHRKILQPAFGPRSFRQVPDVVDAKLKELFAIWSRKRASGTTFVDASV